MSTGDPEIPGNACNAYSFGRAIMPVSRKSTHQKRPGPSRWRFVRAAGFSVALLSLAVLRPAALAGIPEGVWFVEPDSALQIFDCSGLLCGSIVWLRNVHDPSGQIQRDKENPDPALRQRLLCGLTVLWGLRPSGAGRWASGWFYNPDDGKTYRAAAELHSPDTIVARIYLGIPLFGETRTLRRVPRLDSVGWC